MWNNINIPVILGILSLYLAVGSCHWQDVRKHPNLSLLPNDICGPVIIGTRIVNGERAAFLELPWMAVVKGVNDVDNFICGGTVINERYVLTAAHCIKPKTRYYVLLGTRYMEVDVDCEDRVENGKRKKLCAPKPQLFDIKEKITHENFSGDPPWYNDIALLRLPRKADLSSGAVKPICLPIAVSQQKANITGLRAEIAGWGSTKTDGTLSPQLLKASVIIEDIGKCNKVYPRKRIDHLQICAGYRADRQGTCEGDSGGPLSLVEYSQDRMKTVQYGITSGGYEKCGVPGHPSTYTRVGYFIKWILDNIKP